MNLFASIQDVAVDGWAVDMLQPSEAGFGNTAQVVGFKLGMLLGGGILLTIADKLGHSWGFAFYCASGIPPLRPRLFPCACWVLEALDWSG